MSNQTAPHAPRTTASVERLLTAEEVAPLLRCSRATVLRRAAAGQLDYVDIGRRRLFTERQVQKHIDDHSREAKPAQVPARVRG